MRGRSRLARNDPSKVNRRRAGACHHRARYGRYHRPWRNDEPGSSDEFFYIPHANSKERERELADWRRKFNLVVSAAALSDAAQSKITHVKEEFSKANSAAECWAVDNNRQRRITITIIGSASETAMENEYKAASRDFFANPKNFTCKYTYKVGSSIRQP